MDHRGFEKISNAVEEAGSNTKVYPEPEAGINVRYLSISDAWGVSPAAILNALHKAGLMHSEDRASRGLSPELIYLGTDDKIHTFEDVSAQ